jgi:TPR repeat protein
VREGWRLEVAEHRLANRHAEALVLIRQAISEGDMSARVMLAKMGEDAGLSRPDVDAIIDEVEANMEPDDVETHLQLRGAYDIGLGNLLYEEKARRRFEHHLKAVQLGANVIHTLALARTYAMGAIAVPSDEHEAIRWYKQAVQQGSIEAAQELQRLYRHIERRDAGRAEVIDLNPTRK